MNWTEDILQAAAKLGLDPENPRHRDLLAKCIDEALAQPPTRGRPKGTGTWNDADLSRLAFAVDFIKKVEAKATGFIHTDGSLLDGAVFGFGCSICVGVNAPDHLADIPSRHISVGTARNLLARGRMANREAPKPRTMQSETQSRPVL